MTKIGIFRCAQNEKECPMTSCFLSLQNREHGFSGYDQAEIAGIFTLQDSEAENISLAETFKSKGVEVIHFVTCSFSHKGDGKIWYLGNGFFENVDDLARKISRETGLPCVKGTAHLPEEYTVEVFKE